MLWPLNIHRRSPIERGTWNDTMSLFLWQNLVSKARLNPWTKVLSTTARHTRSTWNQSAAQQWMQVTSLHASNHVAYKGWHNLRCTGMDWKDFASNCCGMMAYHAEKQISFHGFGEKCHPKKSVPSQSMAHHNFPWRSRRRYWHFQLQLVVVHLCHPGYQIAFRIEFLPCLVTPFSLPSVSEVTIAGHVF